ncbi:MAG: Methylenetetrahydrofolate reductase [Bradyrhizobium sp.]|nr:Methylenetetrahydrofolate reductase [Bradyrhizobium sp.]
MNIAASVLPGETDHPIRLTDNYSIEMTAKDVASLAEAAPLIPLGTRLSVTYLPGEGMNARVAGAVAVRESGFEPVPHLSARRLASETELETYLEALVTRAQVSEVFVIAGDPDVPLGPYEDALAIIRSGILRRFGIRHVGIAGYPEGHPAIAKPALRRAMLDKVAELERQDLDYAITTQFGFDAEPIFNWLAAVRADSVNCQVKLGVPGPASIKALMRFAARCGVGASTSVLRKYGISITRLIGSAGPDKFVDALAAGLDPSIHGDVALHLYPFGGLRPTAAWVEEYAIATGR